MNEFELRRELRALRVEREPTRDLWPQIDAQLDARRARPQAPWLRLAASVLLAALGLGLWQHWRSSDPGSLPMVASLGSSPSRPDIDPALDQAALQLTLAYRAALAETAEVPLPRSLKPAARELEASAEQIRLALEQQPGQRWLLGQLRRTYEQRLRLEQRAAMS